MILERARVADLQLHCSLFVWILLFANCNIALLRIHTSSLASIFLVLSSEVNEFDRGDYPCISYRGVVVFMFIRLSLMLL